MEKEELYNLYVRVGDFKQIVYGVSKNDLELVFDGIRSKKDFVWLDGRKLLLQYDTFKVYDVYKAFNKFDKGSLKDEIHKTQRISKSKGVTLLKDFGAEVTHKFSIPPPANITDSQKTEKTSASKTERIFISHSSKDHDLVHKFIDHILLLGAGLKRENIFCTSTEGTGIKSGADFRKVILTEMLGAKAVIQFITKNYKTSEVCLNEMGAAWALENTVIPLIFPPFTYDVGFIHASTQQLRLTEERDLIKPYDDHKGSLFPASINTSNYITQVRIFIDFARKFASLSDVKKERMLLYHEVNTIYGTLKKGVFGHPFSEKFEESASFHRYYFLELEEPIDILSGELGIEEGEYDVSHFNQTRIHLTSKDESEIDFKQFEGEKVKVTGSFFGGFTQWHQTSVLMWVENIAQQ